LIFFDFFDFFLIFFEIFIRNSHKDGKKNLRLDYVESSSSLDQLKNDQRRSSLAKSSGKKFNLTSSSPVSKNDQMKYASLHSPRSEISNFIWNLFEISLKNLRLF